MDGTTARARIALIVAVADNGIIGSGGTIPWRLPSDLAHFKRLTMGHTIVMGRRTHVSIGRALPGRRTIVVTSRPLESVETAATLDEAIGRAGRPVFLAGGARIYEEGLARADTLYLTRVHASPAGDVRLPNFNDGRFGLTAKVAGVRTARDEHDFTFETYQRRGGHAATA